MEEILTTVNEIREQFAETPQTLVGKEKVLIKVSHYMGEASLEERAIRAPALMSGIPVRVDELMPEWGIKFILNNGKSKTFVLDLDLFFEDFEWALEVIGEAHVLNDVLSVPESSRRFMETMRVLTEIVSESLLSLRDYEGINQGLSLSGICDIGSYRNMTNGGTS